MKVALVHDYLNQYGGGERVLQVLCEIFPRAPIFTLLYDKWATGGVFEDKEIHTSFLQKIPFTKKHHRIFPMLMPLAIEQFDLSYFDLVISNSASFGKGIITKPTTTHISYCLTPTRFLWSGSHRFLEGFNYPWPTKKLIPFFISYLRSWDWQASKRVDHFVAISHFIRKRIKKYYKRDSEVIYPPVDTSRFRVINDQKKYFFMIGRLVPYKRFDLAVKVFNQTGLPLVIVGDGPEKSRLQEIARDNIKFLGLVSDSKIPNLYSNAKALIFPQEEDFGIVPLEAMASGLPVIAYKAGGVLETIEDQKTGLFFGSQDEESLKNALVGFSEKNFDPQYIRKHAEKFDKGVFSKNIVDLVNKYGYRS